MWKVTAEKFPSLILLFNVPSVTLRWVWGRHPHHSADHFSLYQTWWDSFWGLGWFYHGTQCTSTPVFSWMETLDSELESLLWLLPHPWMHNGWKAALRWGVSGDWWAQTSTTSSEHKRQTLRRYIFILRVTWKGVFPWFGSSLEMIFIKQGIVKYHKPLNEPLYFYVLFLYFLVTLSTPSLHGCRAVHHLCSRCNSGSLYLPVFLHSDLCSLIISPLCWMLTDFNWMDIVWNMNKYCESKDLLFSGS